MIYKHLHNNASAAFFPELKKPNVETSNQKHWYDNFNTGNVSPDAPEYIQKAGRIIHFIAAVGNTAAYVYQEYFFKSPTFAPCRLYYK